MELKERILKREYLRKRYPMNHDIYQLYVFEPYNCNIE
nr:MAG TPA: hypothetical protein [Caudoviricetes sp.]